MMQSESDFFFFSSRRRHTRCLSDWSSDVCSSDLATAPGAMRKSGEVPLHVWLPDAMEGPTPVSALIHAATMVAAGVFLVARVYPLLDLDPSGLADKSTALTVVTWVGCITALFAALIAVG